MMQATWSRIGRLALLGLSLVVGLPALAQAQLFPNRTITRERQPCATEPPFYSTVRRNYFGYYPTCWSKFPDGWGCPCPNPELPNKVAEFQRQPRDPFDKPNPNPDTDFMEGEPGVGAGTGAQPLNNSDIPPVPNPTGRSPFGTELNRGNNLDTPGTPDPSLPPRGGSNPGNRSGGRSGAGSGGNLSPNSNGGGNGLMNPGQTATDRPATTTALLEMPPISAPASASVLAIATAEPTANPGSMTLAPEAVLTSTGSSDRLTNVPVVDNSVPAETMIDPSVLAGNHPVTAPAQAPQRRGILSGLFNSNKRRR